MPSHKTKGGLASALAASLLLGPQAALADEIVCVIGAPKTFENDSIACYNNSGCAHAVAMGGDVAPDYDPESAPFALARGKIGAIVGPTPELQKAAEAQGATCASQPMPEAKP
ncbi:MAG: hypothetical protein ACT4OU_06285 [Hyphomicrobium sp.]